MTIRYIPEGDKFKANQLWGEARHQLSILKNSMSFQNLKQDQRLVRFNDGTIIKCISCFGQDVVKVFVPQQVGEVKYKEDIYIRYYPAIEVWDRQFEPNPIYLGVVLCKGGGFEPPYEFISKDSLPADWYGKSLGKLPKERMLYYSEERRLDDIAPKGVAAVDFVDKAATIPEVSSSGSFIGIATNTIRLWWDTYIWCWRYWGKSARRYSYIRTENLRTEYGFSYRLPGEISPGWWPSYVYEGRTYNGGLKPSHLLNFGGNFYRTVQGSGSNDFLYETFDEVDQYAMKFIVDGYLMGVPVGHWERDDENVNFDSIIALAESKVSGSPSEFTFPERANFYRGSYDHSYLDDHYLPWYQYGSVMDEDHYALLYSLQHKKYGKAYNKSIADIKECIPLGYETPPADCGMSAEEVITDEQTEGPLSVVVDDVVFELFPEAASEVSPRLQYGDLKYFRVGEKSIGLFYIAKNRYEPYNCMYVYAHVTPGGNKAIVTEVPPEWNAEIPGVTDLNGNPVYPRVFTYTGLRLVRETITEEKEIVEN